MKEFQSHYSPSKYNIKNGSDNSNKIRRSPIEKKVQKKQEKYTQELKLREIYLAKKDRSLWNIDDAKIYTAYLAELGTERFRNKRSQQFHEHRSQLGLPSLPHSTPSCGLHPFRRIRRGGRRNVDKGFNSVRMDQRAKIGREDQAQVAEREVWAQGGPIDGPTRTMVNFGSNRLIPGFPGYRPADFWLNCLPGFFNPVDRMDGPRACFAATMKAILRKQ